MIFNRNNVVYTATSDRTQFVDVVREATSFCRPSEFCTTANVNGDKYDDLVSYDYNTGQVHVALRGHFCGTN